MAQLFNFLSLFWTSVSKKLYFSGLGSFLDHEKSEDYLSHTPDLDDIDNFYMNDQGEFLVGIYDEKLVAMGGIKRITPIRAELKRIVVLPKSRLHGFGSAILKRLLNSAKELGYVELCLDTTAQNISSQRLCEKFGFVKVRESKKGNLNVFFYEKKLEATVD